MIDHVSIGVRSLAEAARFHEAVLGTLGYTKMVERPGTIGFGQKYPCLWLNHRPDLEAGGDRGWHVGLRARSVAEVDLFHRTALEMGGRCQGAPGWRHYSRARVYAAFIEDRDGNRIEALFLAELVEQAPSSAQIGGRCE